MNLASLLGKLRHPKLEMSRLVEQEVNDKIKKNYCS